MLHVPWVNELECLVAQNLCAVRLVVRSQAFHACNTGSIPVQRITIREPASSEAFEHYEVKICIPYDKCRRVPRIEAMMPISPHEETLSIIR